jgi:hypothetical protein
MAVEEHILMWVHRFIMLQKEDKETMVLAGTR